MKKINYILSIIVLFLASCEQQDASMGIKVTTVATSELYSDMAVVVGRLDASSSVSVVEKGFFISSERIDRNAPTGDKFVAEGESFSATVNGLTPQKQYFALAYAIDGGGNYYYGYPLSFVTTRPAMIRISNNGATTKTAKTAIITGTVVEDTGIPASRFGIKYWPASEEEPDDESTLIFMGAPVYLVQEGEQFNIFLSGLSINMEYKAKLYAQNDSKGTYGPEFYFSTESIVMPTAKAGILLDADITQTFAKVTGCSMTFNGNDPDAVFGVVYKANASVNDIPDESWTKVQVLQTDTAGNFEYIITGLTYNSAYGVATYVTNDDFTGYSNVVLFNTKDANVPEVNITPLLVDNYQNIVPGTSDYNVGLTHAYLSGTLYNDGGLPITEYGFYVGSDVANVQSGQRIPVGNNINALTGFSAKITGLQAGTTYYYAAFAKSAKGEGLSSAQRFTTAVNGGFLLIVDSKGNNGAGATFKNSTTELLYYELPAITVGSTRYYFLDRNLGATKACTASEIAATSISTTLKEYVGYYYQYGYATPVSSQDAFDIAGTGALNTTNYGWNTTINRNTTWSGLKDPCPAGYRLPTSIEVANIIGVLTSDVAIVKNTLKLSITEIRNNTKGGISGGNMDCAFWTSNTSTVFDTMIAGTLLKTNQNTNGGVPVRCVRVEPVP